MGCCVVRARKCATNIRLSLLYQNSYRMAISQMKGKKSNARRAYLLRCWQEGGDIPDKAPHWRFSVEEVLSKQPRRGFGDLESLLWAGLTKLCRHDILLFRLLRDNIKSEIRRTGGGEP